MMNTVCAAVVFAVLLAVGQSAPLACEKLVKPVEKGPDVITGTWYFIALTTETWWYSRLIHLLLWPSVSVDITAKGPLNTYDWTLKMKVYGYCSNHTDTCSYVNNGFLDGGYVEGKGYPDGLPDVLLQTDCPDCLVIKDGEDEDMRALLLLSRRRSITVAEMEEFKKQAECIGWSKPQVLNTDHDTEYCRTVNEDGLTDLEWENVLTLIF